MFSVLIALKVWTHMGDSIHVRPMFVVHEQCGLGRLMERQTIIEEIRFHIDTKPYCNFCLMVQVSVILCTNQICFLCINIC